MKKSLLLFSFISLVASFKTRAQYLTSGPFSGSITANDASVGNIAWSGAGNACLSDGLKASSTALVIGDKTNYLVIKGFGFNIPTPGIIVGISVAVEKSASGLLQIVRDNSVKLVKGGVITGTDKAVAGAWSGSDDITNYGSTSDLWGETWSISDINSPNFGIAFSANLTSLSALPSAQIDDIKITVYYISTLPVELANFNAQRLNKHNVQLSWETKSEYNSNYFSIERSFDAYIWEEIGQVKAAGNSKANKHYNFVDQNNFDLTTYYRLKQVDIDGGFELSQVVIVSPITELSDFIQLAPNPCDNELNIRVNSISAEMVKAIIFDAESGKIIDQRDLTPSQNNIINTSNLDKGIYFISICNGYSIDKKIKFIKAN